MNTSSTLCDSEARFQLLCEAAPLGVFLSDTLGQCLFTNKYLQKVGGFSAAEALGEGFARFIHPEDRQRIMSEWMTTVASGEEHLSQYRFLRPDGALRWVMLRAAPAFADGRCTGIVGTIEDITERKQFGSELRAREAQLAEAQQLAHIGSWQLDPATGTVSWSDELWRIFGLTPRECGLSFEEFVAMVHPDDRYLLKRIDEEFREASGVFAHDYRITQPNGSLRFLRARGKVVLDEDGRLLKISGTDQDITELKQAELALQEANDRAITEYERLLNRLATLAQSLSSARDLTAIYRALCAFTRASAPCSGLVITIYHPEKGVREAVYFWQDGTEISVSEVPLIPVGKGLVGQAITTGEIIVCEDYIKASDDRPRVWVGTANAELPRPAMIAPMTIMGRVVGTVEIQNQTGNAYELEHVAAMRMAANLAASAIENVRLLEQEREQALRSQQSQKMEAIGTLAGGVAHDFNNLLTVILGNTELALNRLAPDDRVRPRLTEVNKAAKRAAVLTRQLLAFSRRQQMERRNINLNDTIAEIMKLLHRIIGADLDTRVTAGSKLATVSADPAQIEQVVMNLAINARDAMPEGGQLLIETCNVTLDESYQRKYPYVQPGDYVQLKVSDTGCGMDEATKARLFEPFFTTKPVGKGTGLGLSMVYGIVKQHDGHINVYSEPGHGTTFKIFLPIVENQVEKDDAPQVRAAVPGGTETILIAEDEEGLRNLASDVLQELGYAVLLAGDGEEAVQIYKEHRERIDLLLLDVMMPRMGGPEAYQQIRSLGGEVPLIFMTGYSRDMVQSRFISRNILIEELDAVVIQKPYNVDGLGRKVREVLDALPRRLVPSNDVTNQPSA